MRKAFLSTIVAAAVVATGLSPASAAALGRPDLVVTASPRTNAVPHGSFSVLIFRLRNESDTAVPQTTVTLTYPRGFHFTKPHLPPNVQGLPTPKNCTAHKRQEICTIGNQKAHSDQKFEIGIRTFKGAKVGATANVGVHVAPATHNDSDTSTNRVALPVKVVAAAHLKVRVHVERQTVRVGDTIEGTARVTNTGPDAARHVVFSVGAAPNPTYSRVTRLSGAKNPNKTYIDFHLGKLKSGDSATVKVLITARHTINDLPFGATAFAKTYEPNQQCAGCEFADGVELKFVN